MGLFNAMTASVAGLSAQSEAISVISDNIANSNTVGYKQNRTLFSQLVTSSGTGGTSYNAGGVSSNIQRGETVQGSLIGSENATDLALSGSGYFMVTDTADITSDTSTFFTRAGAFAEDKDGYLTSASGNYLQGWKTDSDGNILSVQTPESIELQSVGVSAAATTELQVGINLTSSEGINGVYDTTGTLAAALASVVADPTQADYLSDIQIFDAQGGARDVTLGFTKRAANLWDWVAYTDGSNVEGGVTGSNVQIGNGTVRFDTDGNLKYDTGTDFTVDWSGGVDDGTVSIDFGDYKGGKVATANTGLGFNPDDVHDIAIENDGLTIGSYDVVFTGAGTVELQLGGAVLDTTTIPVTSTQREIVFGTSGVRMTVSPNFDAAPGTYPNTIGNFTVTDITPKGDGDGNNGVIQFSAAYNTEFLRQDGFGSGNLSAIQVDETGLISGTFTNGETKALWKIAVGVFQNPSGLESVSNSLLRTTDSSGQVLLKEAGVGSTASIVSGALEGSTVDIASEFSDMIIVQRAYQANSSVISTVDQMLNDLLQIR